MNPISPKPLMHTISPKPLPFRTLDAPFRSSAHALLGFRAEGAAFLEGEGFGFLDFRALGPSRKAAGLQDL